MQLRPLADKVIVKKIGVEEKTAGGIVIPDTIVAKEKPQKGEVLAVGPGKLEENGNRTPIDMQVGDVILYSKYSGTEVKIDGEEYLIIAERDVLAVFTE